MSWQIQWGYAALAALRSMPWRQAAYVDAAVQRLAAKNQGHLVRVPQVHPYGARLYAGPFVAFLTLDPDAGELTVWFVYRR